MIRGDQFDLITSSKQGVSLELITRFLGPLLGEVTGFDSNYFSEYLTGNDMNDMILILCLQSTLKILHFGKGPM